MPSVGLPSLTNPFASEPKQAGVRALTPARNDAVQTTATAPQTSSGSDPTGASSRAPAASGIGPVYQKSYALVIGMDAYTAWPKLQQAVADSSAVRDALTAHGYTVIHRTNLTSRELKEVLDDFFIERGSEKDVGLVLW